MNEDLEEIEGKVMIDVSYPLKRQVLQDLVISAFEGGSNYWIKKAVVRGRGHAGDVYLAPFTPDEWVEVKVIDYDGEVLPLTEENLVRGIKLLSTRVPRQFENLVRDRWDADTADCVLQLALLGDLVFA